MTRVTVVVEDELGEIRRLEVPLDRLEPEPPVDSPSGSEPAPVPAFTVCKHANAMFEPVEGGFRLGAGPDHANEETAIWLKQQAEAGDTAWEFTVTPRSADRWDRDLIFYLPTVGEGTAGRSADMSAWADYAPTDGEIIAHATGARIAFASRRWQAPGDPTPEQAVSVSLRTFQAGGEALKVEPGGGLGEGLFAIDSPTRVRITRSAGQVAFEAGSGGASIRHAWPMTDTSAGWVGFRTGRGLYDVTGIAIGKLEHDQPEEPDEPPPPEEPDPPIEPVEREVHAGTQAELNEALADAKPGDLILVADGAYAAVNATKGGEKGRPVVLRARSTLGAKLKGATVDVPWFVLEGFDTGSERITVGGDGSQIRRCKVDGASRVCIAITHGEGVEVTYCDVSTNKGQGIALMPKNGNDISPIKRPRIAWNFIHDFVGPHQNVHEGIQIGERQAHSRTKVGAIVEWNLLENVAIDAEPVSVKSSGNLLQYNTMSCPSTMTNRHGRNNTYLCNTYLGKGGIRLHDQGHTVIGNVCEGDAEIRVKTGSIDVRNYPAQTAPGKNHPNCCDTILIGNKGKAVVGHAFEGHKVKALDIRVEGHQGKLAVLAANVGGYTSSPVASRLVPTARRLTQTEVGPFAEVA